MVGWESEGVEVLVRADYGMEGVVGFESGPGKDGLEDLAGDGDGMVFLEVEGAGGRVEYVLGDIVPVVRWKGLVADRDGGRC